LLLASVALTLFDTSGYERALTALDDHEMRPTEVTEVCRVYLDDHNPTGRVLGRKKEIEERLRSSLHAREGHEFDALRRFREEHKGDDQARQREAQARIFCERWPSSEHHALVRTWEENDRAVADAQERRDEQRGDYE